MDKVISSDDMLTVMSNKDVVNITNFVLNKFNIRDEEVRKDITLIATWKAMVYYNSYGQQDFSTNLYRYLKFECIREIKTQYRDATRPDNVSLSSIDFDATFDEKEYFQRLTKENIDSLKEPDRKLIEDYYFVGKTFQEIGDEIGKSKDNARLRLHKITNSLREAVT